MTMYVLMHACTHMYRPSQRQRQGRHGNFLPNPKETPKVENRESQASGDKRFPALIFPLLACYF